MPIIMTIDCECDMIENNLSMIPLFREEKIRKANEVVVYGKYLPTEIWGLIKDYAGINLQGKLDLAFRVGRRNAMRQLEQIRNYQEYNKTQQLQLLAFIQQRRQAFKQERIQALEQQRIQAQVEKEDRHQRQMERLRLQLAEEQRKLAKRLIGSGDANLAEELQQQLQIVRVGDMVFYQKKGMMPRAGRVSKVNAKSIRVTLKNGEDNLIKTVFSILTPGSEKDRRVRQLFSYNF